MKASIQLEVNFGPPCIFLILQTDVFMFTCVAKHTQTALVVGPGVVKFKFIWTCSIDLLTSLVIYDTKRAIIVTTSTHLSSMPL